jgi:nucleoside-diphosphate-sugar epimerase
VSARRALVTGAGGFVCRHIVDALVAGGWHVMALDRQFDPALREAWVRHVEMIEGDAAHLPDVAVSVVVHGAALTASPEEIGMTPDAYLRAQLDPALDVIAWAADRNARLLLISSDAVYAETPPGLLDEDAPTQPRGLYAVAKDTLEKLAATLRAEYHRDIAAIRLGAIYGPGELPRPSRPRISRVGRMIHEALIDGQIAVDTNMRAQSWTYAPDVGAAVRTLLEAQALRHTLYNVASETALTPNAIVEAIRAALPDVRIVESAGAPSHDKRRHTLSNRRLSEDSGFSAWTPFVEGVAATIAWQRAQLEMAR